MRVMGPSVFKALAVLDYWLASQTIGPTTVWLVVSPQVQTGLCYHTTCSTGEICPHENGTSGGLHPIGWSIYRMISVKIVAVACSVTVPGDDPGSGIAPAATVAPPRSRAPPARLKAYIRNVRFSISRSLLNAFQLNKNAKDAMNTR